jgi:hypothetical protein
MCKKNIYFIDKEMHSLRDYVDRIIATNGFISNDNESDSQFYKGYRIFVREDLDSYESVDDWKEDTGGFDDRKPYEGHTYVTEYVWQQFSRGVDVVIDAAYRSMSLGYGEEDSVANLLEKKHMLLIDPDDIIFDVVNLHRKRLGLSEIPRAPLRKNHPYYQEYKAKYGDDYPSDEDDEIDYYDYIDTTSRTAKIEALRVEVNNIEHNINIDVDTVSIHK